jgi:hypothetical protein
VIGPRKSAERATSHGIWAVGTDGFFDGDHPHGPGLEHQRQLKDHLRARNLQCPTASTGQTGHFKYPGDLIYKVTFTDGSTSIVQSVFP